MQKYDIYLGDFDPRKGSAQSGLRPCIIIQSNLFNDVASTCIVVPLTSRVAKKFPSEFTISPSTVNGLDVISRFLGSQVTTIDKRFLSKQLGRLEPEYYPQMREALCVALDFEDEF